MRGVSNDGFFFLGCESADLSNYQTFDNYLHFGSPWGLVGVRNIILKMFRTPQEVSRTSSHVLGEVLFEIF